MVEKRLLHWELQFSHCLVELLETWRFSVREWGERWGGIRQFNHYFLSFTSLSHFDHYFKLSRLKFTARSEIYVRLILSSFFDHLAGEEIPLWNFVQDKCNGTICEQFCGCTRRCLSRELWPPPRYASDFCSWGKLRRKLYMFTFGKSLK